MSKTTRGNSVFSDSNMTLISSNTMSSGGTRAPRAPKDSILYSSTIKEDISEYDHDLDALDHSNSQFASASKSKKNVKIVGQYKKQKSPSPEKTISNPSTAKKPTSNMFKKKRDSVKFGLDRGTTNKRKTRNSTSVPKNLSTSFSLGAGRRSVGDVKPRSSSIKKKEDENKPVVTLHFAGGEKLSAIPDVKKMEDILGNVNSKTPQVQDNTRSTILDIRTATFYYLFALANKYTDYLLNGNPLNQVIQIKNYKFFRDSFIVKTILKNFNLCRFAKIERGAARASKDGGRASWVKIDYSWKLENPRYWPTILLKIASFIKGTTIKQSSFNMT